MVTKSGDPPNQRLLDESMRIPPSPALVKDTLREIGAPDHERTAKLLADNGISLVPVDKPKRKSRSKADRPAALAPQPPPPPRPETNGRPVRTFGLTPLLAPYFRDCGYAVAVHCGKYLLIALAFSFVAGTSFFAFIQLDLYEKIEKLRSPQSVLQRQGGPRSPNTSSIETGSTSSPAPPPPAIGPWHTEATTN